MRRLQLNAVLGWTRILRTQPELPSRLHALEVIERNATSQLRLIEDLLQGLARHHVILRRRALHVSKCSPQMPPS